jgi:hypothetical protein
MKRTTLTPAAKWENMTFINLRTEYLIRFTAFLPPVLVDWSAKSLYLVVHRCRWRLFDLEKGLVSMTVQYEREKTQEKIKSWK